MATEQAFPPTPVGQCEIKTLPAGVLLKASGRGSYFGQSNGLFRPLFNYIASHGIAMTTPVEAVVDEAAMYFWVAPSQRAKVAGNQGGVTVIEVPERLVASRGARGAYSRENFEETRAKLATWLGARNDLEPTGPAYPVYWNGPFLPGFMKGYEVHLPVRRVGAGASG